MPAQWSTWTGAGTGVGGTGVGVGGTGVAGMFAATVIRCAFSTFTRPAKIHPRWPLKENANQVFSKFLPLISNCAPLPTVPMMANAVLGPVRTLTFAAVRSVLTVKRATLGTGVAVGAGVSVACGADGCVAAGPTC